MVRIVRKGQTLFRAFSTQAEAIKYWEAKKFLCHDHCCICENCPNRNYYAEHNHHQYVWSIHTIPLISSNFSEFDESETLYIVFSKSQGETPVQAFTNDSTLAFATYSEAKTYQTQKIAEGISEDGKKEDPWRIILCPYSSTCLYSDKPKQELQEYADDKFYQDGEISNIL